MHRASDFSAGHCRLCIAQALRESAPWGNQHKARTTTTIMHVYLCDRLLGLRIKTFSASMRPQACCVSGIYRGRQSPGLQGVEPQHVLARVGSSRRVQSGQFCMKVQTTRTRNALHRISYNSLRAKHEIQAFGSVHPYENPSKQLKGPHVCSNLAC